MEERTRFVLRADEYEGSFSDLCRQFGISRETGYKWWHRYRRFGLEGLRELSRVPLHSPHETSEEWVGRILEAKQRHPGWGPKKIHHHLKKSKKGRQRSVPAASTIGEIFDRYGYVRSKPKGRARMVGPRHWPRGLVSPKGPNEVWAVDFKGHFRTQDGKPCHPLTVSDIYSRYVLEARALSSPSLEPTRKAFERIFTRYGLPDWIRVDNGVPFAGQGVGGLSRLSVWWLQLGISVQFTDPGAPYQNSVHERMHRTLKADATHPPRAHCKAQQRRFNQWREDFNDHRPHEALQMHVPAALHRPSEKKLPLGLPSWQYPKYYEIRSVDKSGSICWLGRRYFIGEAFSEVELGLCEKEQDCYKVYLGDIYLGDLRQGCPEGLIVPKANADTLESSKTRPKRSSSRKSVSVRRGRR